MIAAEIITALTTLRRRLRALMVIDGLSRWMAGMMSATVLLAILDWWVQFPWFVRVGFLLMGLAWTVVWGYRRVLRPLIHPIALDQLALSLKVLDPDLRDRLAGVIAFQRGGGDGSEQLWQAEIRQAAPHATVAELSAGLNPRRTVRSGLAVVLTSLLLYAIVYANRPIAEIAWGRLVTPTADIRWPRDTLIEPISGDAKIAMGETFTVEMRLVRGDNEDKRGFVVCRIGNRPAEDLMMRRDAGGIYRRVVENVTDDLRYWFRAGDDDTSDQPFRVTVVRRPYVSSLRLFVTPPEYSGDQRSREVTPQATRFPAVYGSRVRLEVTADKPLRSCGDGPGRLTLENGNARPLQMAEPPQTAEAEWIVEQSGWLEIVLVDEDGFESRGGPRLELEVKRDEPPSVTIIEPAVAWEVLPCALVTLRVKATDDVGLRAMRLFAAQPGGDYTKVADLLNDRTAPSPVDANVAYEWDLTPLALNPGDVVQYYCEVEDGFHLNDQRHVPTRSNLMRLSVVTPLQFFNRFRQEMAELRLPIRRLWLATETLKNELSVWRDAGNGKSVTASQRESISRMLSESRRVLESASNAEGMSNRLIHRAETQRAPENELVRQARWLAGRLEETAQGPIRVMTEQLATADRLEVLARVEEPARQAADSAFAAARALREILEELERWESFDELVRKLEELIDRQEAVGRETSRIKGDAKASDATLSARLAGEQFILRDEAERFFASLKAVSQRLRGDQDATGESLERARSEGDRRGVLEHMSEAEQSLRDGRWTQARGAQELAAAGLRAMQIALRDKARRELELLTRSARDLHQRLGQLIKAQESLIALTGREMETAEGAEGLVRLADRQFTLEQTTRRVAVDPQLNAADAGRIQDELMDGARHMASATELLREGGGSATQEAQQAAVESLRAAVALLDRVEARALEDLAEQSFAAIVETLQQIAHSQRTLRDETRPFACQKDSRERSRADRLALNRLSKRQSALQGEFAELRDKMDGSVVFGFVAGQVATRMKSAAQYLTEHQAAAAVEHQEAALHDLELLIAAGKESAPASESRFVSEETGGGEGMNVPKPTSPIPSMAELRALRRLQIELNQRTLVLHRRLPDSASRDARQHSEIVAVGESQRQIHDLARKMVEKPEGGP